MMNARSVVEVARVMSLLTIGASITANQVEAQSGLPEVTKVEVADSVYAIGVTLGGNRVGAQMYAVLSAEGVLLVDANLRHPQLSPLLLQTVGTLSDLPVKYVVVSHWHPDHSGGMGLLGNGAVRIGHDRFRQRISETTEGVDLIGPDTRFVSEPFPAEELPQITYTDELRVYLGDEVVKLFNLPNGHTDGDTYVYLPERKLLHAGDAVWPRMFPSIDVVNGGSAIGLRDNLAQLVQTLPTDVTVVTGHGDPIEMAELRSYVDMLRSTIEEVRVGLSRGEILEQLQERGLSDKWNGWENPIVPESQWI